MGAISNLSTAGNVLRRNPIIFIATLISALVGNLAIVGQVASGTAGIVIALVTSLISVLLVPFFTGGILGMAEEGLTESTGLRTFFSKGVSNYLSILGGGILVGVVFIVAYIAYLIVALIIGFSATAVLSAGERTAAGFLGLGFGLVFTLLVLLAIPLFFLLYLFLYFFDVAIVVSDERAWSGVKRSAGFVRSHFVSAFGFIIITGILGLIPTIPTFWVLLAASDVSSQGGVDGALLGTLSFGGVLFPVLVSVVLSTVFSAFIYAYKVTFYAGLIGTKADERTETAD